MLGFALGIFCYVSTEQGTSIYMSTFLEKYHGVDPQILGAHTVAYFWGLNAGWMRAWSCSFKTV